MPRIPQAPQCDCHHIPTGASEDIKLKVMEEKLKAAIPGIKEVKYVSTEGLTDTYEVVYTSADKASDYITVENGKPLNVLPTKNDCNNIGDAYIGAGSSINPGEYGYLWILDDPSKKEQYPTGWHKGGFVVGRDGKEGIGIAAITKTKTEGLVDTYTITYTNPTAKPETTYTVTNGETGPAGPQGPQGDPSKIKIGSEEYIHSEGLITLPLDCNAKMNRSFTTNVDVGFLDAGTVINETDSIREILYRILYKQVDKHLTNIAITTPPTKTSYTVGEVFNQAGMVVTAYYDDSTSAVVTNYTYSPARALTTADTNIVISYSEAAITKTANQAIVVSEPVSTVKVYYGATDNPPTDLSGLTEKDVQGSELLSADGYEQLIIAGNITTGDGQYVTFALPNSFSIRKWTSEGSTSPLPNTKVIAGNYSIYYLNSPSYDRNVGGINYIIYIKEN